VLYVILCVVCYYVWCVLLYCIVVYCTVLRCSTLPPGINPFVANNNSNK